MTMQKTAIIYARVSSVRQAEDGLPIESQVEQGLVKAAALGANVLKVFRDDGISGRTSKRPAFQDAVQLCAERGVDYFIVWSTSRFARNKLDAASFKKILKSHGTKVVYVSVEIDSATDEGWFSESIFEIVDEHYSRQISKDTKRSMMKNARDGFYNGGNMPFGFTAVEVGRRKKLEIAPLEAKTVRDMFAWCQEGSGCKEISMRLNDQGIARRGKKWDKNTVNFILKNPVYAGYAVFNRRSGTERLNQPESEWIKVKSYPAIIPEEEFDSVQRLLTLRAPAEGSGSPHSRSVFTGLLRCGKCGSSLQIESATGRSATYRYYNCRAALKGIGCANRRIPAPELDSWLTDEITRRIFTREQIAEIIRDVRELTGEWERERVAKIDALADEIMALDRRLGRLFEILETHGKDTPNLGDLTARLREHKARRALLEKEINNLEAERAPELAIDTKDIDQALEFFTDILKTADPKKVRLFFSTFVQSITLETDRVHIAYHPEKLVCIAGGGKLPAATVHSGGGKWLPNQALLRTAIIAFDLPERWRLAA